MFIYVLSQFFSPVIGFDRIAIYGEDLSGRIFYTVIDALGLANAFRTPTFNATWWYMSYAILLIFMLPILTALVEKIGYGIIPISFLVSTLTRSDTSVVFHLYLPVVGFGLVFAKYNLFESIYIQIRRQKTTYVSGFFILVVLIALFTYCRQEIGFSYIFDVFTAVLICLFCYLYLHSVLFLRKGLSFIGKHSMNMFLTHTFVRHINSNFHDFSYSPRYPLLILLLLLADTLLLSIIIEELKKWLSRGWNALKKRK